MTFNNGYTVYLFISEHCSVKFSLKGEPLSLAFFKGTKHYTFIELTLELHMVCITKYCIFQYLDVGCMYKLMQPLLIAVILMLLEL